MQKFERPLVLISAVHALEAAADLLPLGSLPLRPVLLALKAIKDALIYPFLFCHSGKRLGLPLLFHDGLRLVPLPDGLQVVDGLACDRNVLKRRNTSLHLCLSALLVLPERWRYELGSRPFLFFVVLHISGFLGSAVNFRYLLASFHPLIMRVFLARGKVTQKQAVILALSELNID